MSPSRVDKRWGHEDVLHLDGEYMAKKLFLRRNHMTSMHHHVFKTETIMVVQGSLMITMPDGARHVLCPGDSLTIEKGVDHRMTGLSDVHFFEASGSWPEDSVRVCP